MKRYRFYSFAAACCFAVTLAKAENGRVVPGLPEVLITATQVEQPSAELPFMVETITSEELRYRLPRTVPEALRQTPGVMVQKTGHGQGSPFIRGFTGFRTLMLVDGIRLNNSVFREGPNQYWNTVDAFSIDRLELVKGPGSVLYGSDAIGGTVNALTLRREEYNPGFDWDRRIYYRGSSAENSHMSRGEISGNLDEKLGFVVGGGFKHFGDLKAGKEVGTQRHTGYDEWNADVKLEYFFNLDSRLVFGHQTVDQNDAWRTHRTIFGTLWRGTKRGDEKQLSFDQHRDLTYLQYHSVNLPGFVEEVHASISHHLQTEDEFRIRKDDRRDFKGFDVNTLGLSFNLHSPSPVGRWVYGGEYYRDWVDSYSRSFNADGTLRSVDIQGPVADEATYDLFGFFVEDNLKIGDRVDVIVGGRYTYAAASAERVKHPVTDSQISLSDEWDALVGSLRGLVRINEEAHWTAFAGVSQGFRAPNLSDLTRFEIAASGEQEVPSPNLKPEHFISYEIGLKTSYDKVTAQLGYFYTDISDLIVRTPTGNLVGSDVKVIKSNGGDGYVHGIELDAIYHISPEWSARGAFTWMEGELETFVGTGATASRQKEPLSRAMPTTLQLSLKWEPVQKLWLEGMATFAARQDRLSSADRRDDQRIPPDGTPGYAVYTIRAGWRATKNLTFAAAVENLTDEDYRIHGSGLNEPGRNFIISADLRF